MKVSVGPGRWRVVSNDSECLFECFVNNTSLPDPEFEVTQISKIFIKLLRPGRKPLDVHIESV